MPTGIYQRKSRSSEYRQHIREALLGKKHTSERVEANRLGQIKRFQRPEEREKAGRANRGNKMTRTPEYIAKLRNNARRRWANPEFKHRMSKILTEIANRPEVKANNLRRLRIGLNKHIKPNKPGTELLELLTIRFPNQWKYTGNWDFMIGHRNPDFVNVNGQKQIIELFGVYWHSIFDIAKVTNFYKQYGFTTLIIWEDELSNTKKLVSKIRKFSRYKPEGGAEIVE